MVFRARMAAMGSSICFCILYRYLSGSGTPVPQHMDIPVGHRKDDGFQNGTEEGDREGDPYDGEKLDEHTRIIGGRPTGDKWCFDASGLR